PVSEYDIKGMTLRRSNYPKFTKDKLITLLDMILKEEKLDIEKINKYVNETKKEAIEECIKGTKDVAGAVNYNKEDHEYKGRIPYQVLAMKAWNQLEYKYFMKGTKGYLFRIHGIDMSLAPDRIIKNMDKFQN